MRPDPLRDGFGRAVGPVHGFELRGDFLLHLRV